MGNLLLLNIARKNRGAGLVCACVLWLSHAAQAQLAITEVMSAPWTNPLTGFRGPEYWELTNFGTNDISLHGYGFRDGVTSRSLEREPFINLVIHAGESVVFFRVADAKDSVTNTAQFRTWWGNANLPANLQCRTWESPGLSGWDGDAVVLFDATNRLVDSVQFGRARLGRAFTYEPETGLFGILSISGVQGAFTAVLADDVGSPGRTTGVAPLRFLQQPVAQAVDAGMNVTFSSVAVGLPRPRYLWFKDDAPLSFATAADLILPAVQADTAGKFHVLVANGLETVTSLPATLGVNTNPAPPVVLLPPADTTVFDHQTVAFQVFARGLPAPTYQWQSNHVNIFGAVGPRLELRDVTAAWSGMQLSVRISNELGTTEASALLTVTPRPDLRFTEVMALPSDEEGNRHFDWFELTNYETNAIDLKGWRFSDQPSFARAFVITNALTLAPGESAVFAERLDERLFGDWWGRDNLPTGLKVCTYSSFGLSYLGEQLFLWNAAAVDPNDYLISVSWAAATLGVSFESERWCDPLGYGCLDDAKIESVAGMRGAFRAANGMDIGSPGYVTNPPLQILSIQAQSGDQFVVRCRVISGHSYELRSAPALAAPEWQTVAAATAYSNLITFTDARTTRGPVQFYRVREVP